MWKDRVRAELTELTEKLDKLNKFIADEEKFDVLDPDARFWLLRQKLAMTEYQTILQCRIM